MGQVRGSLFLALFSSISLASECSPLGATVLVFHEWDLESCPTQVVRAGEAGASKLHILFTGHFLVDQNQQMEGYCFRSKSGLCEPFTPELISKISNLFSRCLNATQSLEQPPQEIAVTIHLDDGRQSGVWRNNLIFDPLQKYGGNSYAGAIVRPIAIALNGFLRDFPNVSAEFAVQGEMGATLAHYPNSYRKLLKKIQSLLGKTQARVGISLNYNKVFGTNGAFDPENRADFQALINEAGFLGISAYHYMPLPIEPGNFDLSFLSLVAGFESSGVVIPENKKFRISEIGIGGGTSANDGETIAVTPSQSAGAPWAGIYGPYVSERDPWKSTEMKKFRFDFHHALLVYLEQGLSKFKTVSAYLWNSNSWDVLGLYSGSEKYQDFLIAERIREHNLVSCK